MVLLAEILEISFDAHFTLYPNNFTSCGQHLLLLIRDVPDLGSESAGFP